MEPLACLQLLRSKCLEVGFDLESRGGAQAAKIFPIHPGVQLLQRLREASL